MASGKGRGRPRKRRRKQAQTERATAPWRVGGAGAEQVTDLVLNAAIRALVGWCIASVVSGHEAAFIGLATTVPGGPAELAARLRTFEEHLHMLIKRRLPIG
jgi:hypothetical protein